MEDAHVVFEIKGDPNNAILFGVFDGHGGKEVAEFCKANIQQVLESQESIKKQNYEEALKKTFFQLDEQLSKQEYAEMTGTTACVILVTDDAMYCCNSGDSRGVLCSKGKAIPLSYDHKPSNPGEQSRIEKIGHFVEDDRVDGNLALSRAIGDFQYKDKTQQPPEDQAVTCNPDIIKQNRNHTDDQFIILACDGIWDCKENQQCVDFLSQKISGGRADNFTDPLEHLLEDCCAENSDEGIGTDNMTAILI